MIAYATSTWCWTTEQIRVDDLIEEFIGYGYNAMSFSTAHLKAQPEDAVRRAAELVKQHNLPVTFHGNTEIGFDQLMEYVAMFSPHVACITFDATRAKEPRGMLYDAAEMAPFIRAVLDATADTDIPVGVEDFPLNCEAADFYGDDLAAVIDDPRFGMLVDVGHMNMYLTSERYYAGMSIADYFTALPLPVIELHLHDNNGYQDQHGWFGMGTLDFAAVADAARAIGFDGVSTIEIAPGMHGSTPDADRRHARTTLEQWKTLWPTA